MALDEGLDVVPLHGLQDPRHHKHAALQAVLCTLQTHAAPPSASWSVLELKELQVQVDSATHRLCHLWDLLGAEGSRSFSVEVVSERGGVGSPLFRVIGARACALDALKRGKNNCLKSLCNTVFTKVFGRNSNFRSSSLFHLRYSVSSICQGCQ